MSTGLIERSQSLVSLHHDFVNEEKFSECHMEEGKGKAHPIPLLSFSRAPEWFFVGWLLVLHMVWRADRIDSMNWEAERAISSCGRLDRSSLQDRCTVSQTMEIAGRKDRSYTSGFTEIASRAERCLGQLGNHCSWQTLTGQSGMLGELTLLSLSKGLRPIILTEGSEEKSNMHC